MKPWIALPLGVLCAGILAAQNPVIVDGGTLNGASFAHDQAVAPGSLVSVFGDNLATTLESASTVPLSTTLQNVSVTVGGIAAPLHDVIPGSATSRAQINAQIPWDVLQGQLAASVPVIVTTNGVASAPQQVQVAQVAPGIFTIPPGVGNAIAINPDGSIAAPVGSIVGFPCHPAQRGVEHSVFIYATGLGPVDSPVNDGAASTDRLRKAVNLITLVVDGISVTPQFAGLSPQFPGVNQINFEIPAGARSGVVALQIQTPNGTLYPPASSTPTVVIAIE
ncbi:MAG: hypothetical protein ABI693_03585 [Bryobacteraceae bacterium]